MTANLKKATPFNAKHLRTRLIVGAAFVFIIVLVLGIALAVIGLPKDFSFSVYPACPAQREGLLTNALIDPDSIVALTPLGNVNPPGHTSPVDHIYFQAPVNLLGKEIPLYYPADGWLTQVDVDYLLDDASGKYRPVGYAYTYALCNSLTLKIAGATRVPSEMEKALEDVKSPNCKYGVLKPGHGTTGACYYPMNLPVKAGDSAGWATGNLSQTIEVWAYDYNSRPDPNINWDYYGDSNYAHSFCLFDLYAGDLRDRFFAKFGQYRVRAVSEGEKKFFDKSSTRPEDYEFVPRTTEPLCGTIIQDQPGTVQGMWFGGEHPKDVLQSLEFSGMGLAFLHNNIDPAMGEISIGGWILPKSAIWVFPLNSDGRTNREFSQTAADGGIYCYRSEMADGKMLVQLMDAHHLRAEYQAGACGGAEAFVNPLQYQR